MCVFTVLDMFWLGDSLLLFSLCIVDPELIDVHINEVIFDKIADLFPFIFDFNFFNFFGIHFEI